MSGADPPRGWLGHTEVLRCKRQPHQSRAWRHAAGGHSDIDAFVEMQLASPAVVEKAISDVAILLDFAQLEACTDGVNRAGRDEVGVTGAGGNPAQFVFE